MHPGEHVRGDDAPLSLLEVLGEAAFDTLGDSAPEGREGEVDLASGQIMDGYELVSMREWLLCHNIYRSIGLVSCTVNAEPREEILLS